MRRITDSAGALWPDTGRSCPVCGWPTDPILDGEPHPLCMVRLPELEGIPVTRRDPLLDRSGVMQAVWWSVCRGCSRRIREGDTQVLAYLPGGERRWVCRPCGLALRPELCDT